MFNAPNQQGITGRASSMTLASPSDPVTITNLPYDAAGNIIPTQREAVERRLWSGDCLAAGTADTGADTILVLIRVAELR